MSFSKRQGNDTVCYTKPLDSLKSWNDHFFWVDAFACPASFPRNTRKSVSKDPIPKSSEFNAEHYATLVSYPALFHKYREPFLCLVGIKMDFLSFIQTADLTKVRVDERQRAEDKPRLLDTTVGRVVPLLPIAPACAENELDTSVDKLFDEGGREDNVWEDHGTSTGPSVAGKSKSALQRLLARAVLNPEVGVAALPTLPFITSSVSVTPEREDGNQSDFMVQNIAEAELILRARPSVDFSGLYLVEWTFIVGGIRTVVSPDTDLQKVYVPQWSFTNGAARQMLLSAKVRMCVEFNIREKRRLCYVVEEKNSLLKARDEEIRSLKAQLLVKETEVAEAIHLRAEASKFEVVEKSLQDEIKYLKERNTTLEEEKGVLDVKVADLEATVKVREQEAADSDAMVTTVKLQNDKLADQKYFIMRTLRIKVAVCENCMSQLEKFQDEQMAVMHEKFNKLDADFIETCLHLEEKFYHILSAGITHGQEGRVLADVAAFNPSAEDDFTSALQEVQNVNFSLLAELQSNKDASVETVMDLLRLDEALTESARALSLSLDVSHGRVLRIRENIANNISTLRDVFVLFSEPLSVADLEGTTGTSSVAPDITTALSVTLASASTIPPISIDDYEIAHEEDHGNADADVDPFPNVDEAELIIS
ncbi:hypothetical protein Tco_1491315 [Tanacetum coccineum]